MKRKPMSYQRKKGYYGYIFISLWLIGFFLFFFPSFLSSIKYSFSDVKVQPGDIITTFIGLENYEKAFKVDTEFTQKFLSSLGMIAFKTPIIVFLSLFIAMLLNQEFKGRTLARSIFFLPVIITSGVVISLIEQDTFLSILMSGERSANISFLPSAERLIQNLNINSIITEYIASVISDLFRITWYSGIQILLFISALQSVPVIYYEVAQIEGATLWESFWKVTMPSIKPMILVNVIYTIIDNFISYSNPMFQKIQVSMSKIDFGYAAAMTMINFVVLLLVILIVYYLINRKTDYIVN